ncbi:hypothetical protein AN963_10010 [Brevibacillus choshinensis]|uniref:IclR family transcriptional regulator n=1 Tax=Brevibacillus choshinensis TaxID=54911 RepID=A0ABR5NEU1_BRECH|nr:IclR family transcriptional regulator [Brevibacillus choshinensis]KQL49988.1 hypothetical protein AN963_10010 [Brevibacillus choshinensis]
MEESQKVRAVDRALDIIEVFTFKEPELLLVEIAERTGLALATVHRSIQTMIKRGYIEQDPISGKFRLGMQFVKIGGIVIQRIDLTRIATPFLQELSKRTEQNVNMSIYDKGEALCLVNIESFHNFQYGIKVGQRLPIYAGALSKLIMANLPPQELTTVLSRKLEQFTPYTISQEVKLRAELEEIRARGYARSEGELAMGAAALAAPVYNYENRMVAGISISGPEHFYGRENVNEYLRELLKMAEIISIELGFNKVNNASEPNTP